MVSAILQNVRDLHSIKLKSALRKIMGLFPYFHCNWLLFFNGFVLHPGKPPTICTQINSRWESRQAELGCTTPLRWTHGLGNVCFFRPEQ